MGERCKNCLFFQQYRKISKMCRNQFIIPALYIVHCFRHIFLVGDFMVSYICMLVYIKLIWSMEANKQTDCYLCLCR